MISARYYDPRTGRFLSEDPANFLGGDNNLYRYVLNNPLKYTDPSGKFLPFVGIIAGAGIANGVGSFVGTIVGGGTISEAVESGVSGVVTGAITGAAAIGAVYFGTSATVTTVVLGTLTNVGSSVIESIGTLGPDAPKGQVKLIKKISNECK